MLDFFKRLVYLILYLCWCDCADNVFRLFIVTEYSSIVGCFEDCHMSASVCWYLHQP